MILDKKLKDQTDLDWQLAFPELTLQAKSKLYKILGPVVVGLDLKKIPYSDEYRPYFVVYPLWKEDVKSCLNAPIILKQHYDRRGFQYSIPFQGDGVLFADAVNSVRNNTPISFDRDISLAEMFQAIDNRTKEAPLEAAPNSYLQAVMQASKLEIALFLDKGLAQTIFFEISQRNWDLNHFAVCGVNLKDWLHSLQREIDTQSAFLKQIELNTQDRKLLRLKRSELRR